MRSFFVVEPDVLVDPPSRFSRRGIFVEKHFFIFQAPEEAFHDDIVQGPTFPVHADENGFFQQPPGVLVTGKVTPLIAVPEDGRPPGKGLVHGFHDKSLFQALIEFPGQKIPGIPVDNGHEIEPAPLKADVGDIDGPDLVGNQNGPVPEEIGIDPVLLVPTGEIGTGMNPFDSHLPHVFPGRFPADGPSFGP